MPRSASVASSALAVLLVALFAATAWAAFWPLPSEPGELVYVVPPGTSARIKAGERLSVLPATVRLTLGVQDVLVVRNEDDATHQLGPILLAPRQTYRIPFRRVMKYQYACTLHSGGQLVIVVENTPAPGWERFRWRLASYVGRLTGDSAHAEGRSTPQ